MKRINVIELFAGVGGFRVGLDRADSAFFKTIWANQWEPATKIQHASMVYKARFGEKGFCGEDINLAIEEGLVPSHNMLVGGFPCQDYSVASTLSRSKGIEGKKGVLWWSIYNILVSKGNRRPAILFLENVDRLLLSPASQRGRDFAIILECLNSLGYVVEWRVINAADYCMPQKRRRTYILAYRKGNVIGKRIRDPRKWIFETGVFAKAFPILDEGQSLKSVFLSSAAEDRLVDITQNFNHGKTALEKPFEAAGVMKNGIAYSTRYTPNATENYEKPTVDGKTYETLRDVMASGDDIKYVTEDFYIPDDELERWKYFKGPKKEPRIDKKGFEYFYAEGGMAFPDNLDSPSRTIITSEGGKSPDRCRHVIIDQTGRYRRLIPLELERLNMFPDNHTLLEGVTDSKRAFLMGNALVVGIVTKVGEELARRLKQK